MMKLRPNSLVRPKVFWPSIIILLVTSLTFYILKEKEKSLKIYTQRQLVEAIMEKKAFEDECIITLKKLATEKEKSLALEKKVEEKERQIKLVLDKLEKEIISRRVAEIQLILATKEKRNLRIKLRQLTEMPETIELEKVVVKAVPVLTGRVLIVNKSEAFIVVNLGRTANLKIGDVLSVYRNDEFIGRVEVEKVEEKVSAAAIMSEWQDVEFRIDDEVREI